MIFKCQRKPIKANEVWHVHTVDAPDAATARVMMFNRGLGQPWLDHSKTDVWSEEEFTP